MEDENYESEAKDDGKHGEFEVSEGLDALKPIDSCEK